MTKTIEPPIKQLLESQEPIIRWKLITQILGKSFFVWCISRCEKRNSFISNHPAIVKRPKQRWEDLISPIRQMVWGTLGIIHPGRPGLSERGRGTQAFIGAVLQLVVIQGTPEIHFDD